MRFRLIRGGNTNSRCFVKDNVYTVCDSEVVAANCYHVTVVGDSTYRTVVHVAVFTSCFSV